MKQTLSLVLLIFILSCSNNQDNSKRYSDLKNVDNDSLFYFLINGTKEEYKVSKSNINLIYDLGKLQKFINEYEKNPQHKIQKKLEITGEGIGNTFYSLIKKQKDGFLVTHLIYQNDPVIWCDSLIIDDAVSYSWDDDPLFYKLKPYSTFSIACSYADRFINDPIDISSESYRENYTNIPNENDTAYWDKYLRNFKGRTIYKLSLEDGGTWIWDIRKRKFIDFFEP
ncbi:MAG: hypothetical protein V4538_00150 [Bacteroidota bacterium]